VNFKNRIIQVKNNFNSSLRGSDNTKVVVLGHQKSGTTVIANLIAKSAELSYSNDPIYNTDKNSTRVLKYIYGDLPAFYNHVNKNKSKFFHNVVKDPDFSFSFQAVKELYPKSKYLFVERNPLDIIRSIFNRLGIDGRIDCKSIDGIPLKRGTEQWRYILNGDGSDDYTVIERLSHRIETCMQIYKENEDELILLKYEDFLLNKRAFIEGCCRTLNFPIKKDISGDVDTQFQPKGDAKVDPESFFGKENYEKIISIGSFSTL
tara:strand:+ start:1846 stop:2631 length:786 start_codon:yes stop_codon:yes gene_type:complete